MPRLFTPRRTECHAKRIPGNQIVARPLLSQCRGRATNSHSGDEVVFLQNFEKMKFTLISRLLEGNYTIAKKTIVYKSSQHAGKTESVAFLFLDVAI